MANLNRIFFWEILPSPHQSAFIAALGDRLGVGSVTCVYEQPLDEKRLAMGWQQPDFGTASVFVEPDPKVLEALLEAARPPAVNVVGGIVSSPWCRSVAGSLAQRGARMGLISEARDYRGRLGILRILHGQVVERRWRDRLDFVLAMGEIGRRWFKLCGYREAQLFTFPYVVEEMSQGECPVAASEVFKIIIVGRLVKLKRVDMVLDALADMKELLWSCAVVGDGPEREVLETKSRALGLGDRIGFLGNKSNREVRGEMACADLLVFASEADGWGAVVNEALMAGTPAVVSDYCGAADLIRSGFNGTLFETGSASSLKETLRRKIQEGKTTTIQRNQIKGWSKSIAGPAIADYLVDIMADVYGGGRGQRPVPPWTVIA